MQIKYFFMKKANLSYFHSNKCIEDGAVFLYSYLIEKNMIHESKKEKKEKAGCTADYIMVWLAADRMRS